MADVGSWIDRQDLSSRLYNFLCSYYWLRKTGGDTKARCFDGSWVPRAADEIIADIENGSLAPGKCIGYGKVSHRELCAALGIENRDYSARIKIQPRWIFHPITGEKLK